LNEDPSRRFGFFSSLLPLIIFPSASFFFSISTRFSDPSFAALLTDRTLPSNLSGSSLQRALSTSFLYLSRGEVLFFISAERPLSSLSPSGFLSRGDVDAVAESFRPGRSSFRNPSSFESLFLSRIFLSPLPFDTGPPPRRYSRVDLDDPPLVLRL